VPGLREQVISIICEEWANPDNEVRSGTIYVPSATIYERLRSNGVEASEDDVRQELQHLAGHGDITLMFEPSRGAGPTIADVSPKLCPEPRS
jgi:hypothetical protein